jgi:tetraacyldisaccharide 4'-kinase
LLLLKKLKPAGKETVGIMKINSLKNKIEAVISGKDNDSHLAKVLLEVSKAYAHLMALRLKLYNSNLIKTLRLPCKVISIGNITLGGTGKTPMTLYVAELIRSMGFNAAIVCRGYRGEYEHSTEMVTDGATVFLGPEQAGDEPYLIATKLCGVPVFVGKNRYASGLKAWIYFHPDVIILDDAFQHIRLFRDLDLLLLDAAKPLGNGHVFPRGILRESPDKIERADAVVITRAEPNRLEHRFFKENKIISEKPIFRCRHVPDTVSVLNSGGTWEKCSSDNIRYKKCLAFAGIAKNEEFLCMLKNFGCRVADFINFPDHHQFSVHDVETILRTAQKKGVKFLVTTEKDRVKLPQNIFLTMKIYSIGVRMSFIENDQQRFRKFVYNAITSP